MKPASKQGVAVDFLFGQPGEVIRDVKFFVGTPPFTEEDFWEQVHSAMIQERMGTAVISTEFQDSAKTIDARAFLNGL